MSLRQNRIESFTAKQSLLNTIFFCRSAIMEGSECPVASGWRDNTCLYAPSPMAGIHLVSIALQNAQAFHHHSYQPPNLQSLLLSTSRHRTALLSTSKPSTATLVDLQNFDHHPHQPRALSSILTNFKEPFILDLSACSSIALQWGYSAARLFDHSFCLKLC